jgi:hypothetical protein
MKYLIGVLLFVEIGDVIDMGIKAFSIVVIPVIQFLDRLFSQPGVEVDQTTRTAPNHPKRIICETSAFRVEKLFVHFTTQITRKILHQNLTLIHPRILSGCKGS